MNGHATRKGWAAATGRLSGIGIIVFALASCAAPPEAGMVVGSGHLLGIVETLMAEEEGERPTLHTLIPPGMCPGHFDMRPSDMSAVIHSRAVVIHDWQTTMPNVKNLLEAADIPPDRIHVVDTPGSWMEPAVQADAVQAVAEALGRIEPDRAETYAARAEDRAVAIQAFGETTQAGLEEHALGDIPVIANEMQADFVEWLGFDVVGVFPRSEYMSVAELERFLRICRDESVVLVIENLQSGDPQNSKAIARDGGAGHVVLTNFPGGFGGDASWEKAVEANIALLLDALSQAHG